MADQMNGGAVEADSGLLHLVAPSLTMFLVALPAVSLTEGLFQKGFNIVPALIVAPFWIGLLAAPGYAFACLGEPSRLYPRWVRFSLFAALLASLGGVIGSLPILFPLPFTLATAYSCVSLLRRDYLRRKAVLGATASPPEAPLMENPTAAESKKDGKTDGDGDDGDEPQPKD